MKREKRQQRRHLGGKPQPECDQHHQRPQQRYPEELFVGVRLQRKIAALRDACQRRFHRIRRLVHGAKRDKRPTRPLGQIGQDRIEAADHERSRRGGELFPAARLEQASRLARHPHRNDPYMPLFGDTHQRFQIPLLPAVAKKQHVFTDFGAGCDVAQKPLEAGAVGEDIVDYERVQRRTQKAMVGRGRREDQRLRREAVEGEAIVRVAAQERFDRLHRRFEPAGSQIVRAHRIGEIERDDRLMALDLFAVTRTRDRRTRQRHRQKRQSEQQ